MILHIQRNRTALEFFRVIRTKPVALDLLISYAKQQDLKLLKELHESSGQYKEAAQVFMLEAFRGLSQNNDISDSNKNLSNDLTEEEFDEKINSLEEALQLYTESKESFLAKATEDQIKLLLIQKDVQTECPEIFVGLSVTETVEKLIIVGNMKRVAKLRSEFKIPDKRFWWVKVKALGKVRDWEELERFSKEKKSPIGYLPFIQVCVENGAPQEGERYLAKIIDPGEKVEGFCKLQ